MAVVGTNLSERPNFTDDLSSLLAYHTQISHPRKLKERLKFVSELGKLHKKSGDSGFLSRRDAGT